MDFHASFTQDVDPVAVEVNEEPAKGTGSGSRKVSLKMELTSPDRYLVAALRTLLPQLPALIADAREGQLEERLQKLMAAILPADPLADVLLGIDDLNLKARRQFVKKIPMLDSKQLSDQAGHANRNASQTAYRWKSQGRVFAVPHGGTDFYPAFQFEDGEPRPAIARILKELGDARTPWQIAFWFVAGNGWLAGKRPLDLLSRDPDAVVKAAHREVEPRDD